MEHGTGRDDGGARRDGHGGAHGNGGEMAQGHGSMAQRGVGRMQHGGMDDMSPEQRKQMRREHHQRTLWVPATVLILGLWLLTSPFTFGYASAVLTWSDVVSGLLLVIFGAVWFWTPRWPWIPWAACFVGMWLQVAPLVFWAPTPVAYLTDTFVGAWVIALTILIPGMPGMIMNMEMGPEVPPGWSYNPSSWLQRAPLIATGFLGWFISRYLAAVQLGYLESAWDPFFGESTLKVLHSEMSRSWPISDAGLGAFAYTIEALMGFMGGTQRWRTMPWMVLFFGILVIPLGLVHIFLVISQPVVVGYWCFLCLAAAAVMLVMIPLSVDEVVAMCQFMLGAVRDEGKPFWRTFWLGGTVEGGANDERTPDYREAPAAAGAAMLWGVSFPWTLAASVALGVWLMFAPAVLGTTGAAAGSNHVAGALVITVSVCVLAEVLRPGRFLNALLGAWIIAAPWVLSGAGTAAQISNALAGLALIALCFPLGPIRERYGGWDRYLAWPAAAAPAGADQQRRRAS